MTSAAALFVVAAFMALLSLLGVPARAGAIVARSRQALATVRDRTLSDEAKEKAVQAHALGLFGAFFVVTALSLLALALPVGAVAALAATGLLDFDAVMAATMSWPVLLVATVAGVALYVVLRRGRRA